MVLLSLFIRPAAAAGIKRFTENRGVIRITNLGVRCTEVERVTARRWPETIETPYGPLQVKVMEYGGRRRLLPEYEACRRMAEAQGVPLIEVYRLVPRE